MGSWQSLQRKLHEEVVPKHRKPGEMRASFSHVSGLICYLMTGAQRCWPLPHACRHLAARRSNAFLELSLLAGTGLYPEPVAAGGVITGIGTISGYVFGSACG